MEKETDEEKYVTRDEFDSDLNKFAQAVKARFDELKERMEALRAEFCEPKQIQASFYRCSEEGCEYVTDDLAAYVEHVVREELQKPSEHPTPRTHRSVAEFLDCPECFPQFEKVLLEKGWEKPKPERKPII